MTVFIIAPIIAPGIGEALLIVGSWDWIFHFLLLVAMLTIAWSSLRLPETQPPEKREPLSLAWLIRAFGETVTTRQTVGYTVSAGLIFGALLGYINSAQQIFVDIYSAGSMFPVLFGIVAISLAAAAFLNGKLVVRLGMRWLSHLALIGFFGVAVILLALSLLSDGVPPLWAFCALLSLNLFCFGFAMPNYNALAMEPLGHIAGTASSFVGAFTTAGAAVLGWYVGQQFDGTVVPLALGYVGLGALAILAVVVTERGRLFTGRTA
jgi:MFS transporter, DHA1 family, multidrug resistance protein